jgi:hypothetical protein
VTREEANLRTNFEYQDKRVADGDAAVQKDAADRLAALKLEDYQIEAVVWLQARGKVLGKDFLLSTAIYVADSLAFDEEVARLTKNCAGNYIDFNGQNCEGPCEGWNGVDRRCACGNRRVCWVMGWGYSFKNPSLGVIAEAH